MTHAHHRPIGVCVLLAAVPLLREITARYAGHVVVGRDLDVYGR